MKLKVYKYGEQVLREKATPVAVVDDNLRKLAEDMIETMHAAKGNFWDCTADYSQVNAKRDMAKYRQYMKDQVRELLTNYGKIAC